MTCEVYELNVSQKMQIRSLYVSVQEAGWWCTIRLCNAGSESETSRVPVVHSVASWRPRQEQQMSIKGDVHGANDNQGSMRE